MLNSPREQSGLDGKKGENGTTELSSVGASLLVLTQVFTKLATFSLNQLLVQYVTPTVLGNASYWEFVGQTILFFSREAARLAVQRAGTQNEEKNEVDVASGDDLAAKNTTKRQESHKLLQTVVNFGYIPIVIGIPLSVVMAFCCYNASENNGTIVALVITLVLLELMAEPMYVLNQYQLGFGKRSRIESLAVVGRCVTTFFGVMYASHTNEAYAVLAYIAGQLVYAAIVYGLYRNPSYHLKAINGFSGYKRYLSPQVLSIWRGLFVQMLFKHLLTEGDRLLIGWLCSVEEQGVYALVTNYGSILARVLFQPVEESLRLVLARELTNKNAAVSAHKTMGLILLAYFNLSILMLLGGLSNGAYVLQTALGTRKALVWLLTNVFEIFPRYILYLPFLAFNGVLEAFFSSTASENQIQRFSFFMLALTAVVLMLLYYLILVKQWGLNGLMIANGVNMTLRILYCTNFMQSYFHKHGLRTSLLDGIWRVRHCILMAVASGFFQHTLAQTWHLYGFAKLALSSFTCLTYLLVIAFTERQLVEPSLRRILQKVHRQ